MSINDGGPAFPQTTIIDAKPTPGMYQSIRTPAAAPGMTIRQWLAGMAMQGILANPVSVKPSAAVVAAAAYAAADAMIAHEARERAEKEETK